MEVKVGFLFHLLSSWVIFRSIIRGFWCFFTLTRDTQLSRAVRVTRVNQNNIFYPVSGGQTCFRGDFTCEKTQTRFLCFESFKVKKNPFQPRNSYVDLHCTSRYRKSPIHPHEKTSPKARGESALFYRPWSAPHLSFFYYFIPRHSIKIVMDHQEPFSGIKIIISRARKVETIKTLLNLTATRWPMTLVLLVFILLFVNYRGDSDTSLLHCHVI